MRSVFQLAMPENNPASFLVAGRPRIVDDRSDGGHRVGDHARHDGVEQGGLRVEVVVEGAARRVQLVEQILDAHLLVALGLDEPLGSVDERVPTNGIPDRVDRPSHGSWCPSIHRPTVGLMILRPSMERPLTGKRRFGRDQRASPRSASRQPPDGLADGRPRPRPRVRGLPRRLGRRARPVPGQHRLDLVPAGLPWLPRRASSRCSFSGRARRPGTAARAGLHRAATRSPSRVSSSSRSRCSSISVGRRSSVTRAARSGRSRPVGSCSGWAIGMIAAGPLVAAWRRIDVAGETAIADHERRADHDPSLRPHLRSRLPQVISLGLTLAVLAFLTSVATPTTQHWAERDRSDTPWRGRTTSGRWLPTAHIRRA